MPRREFRFLVVMVELVVAVGAEGHVAAKYQEAGADQEPVPAHVLKHVVREAEHDALDIILTHWVDVATPLDAVSDMAALDGMVGGRLSQQNASDGAIRDEDVQFRQAIEEASGNQCDERRASRARCRISI